MGGWKALGPVSYGGAPPQQTVTGAGKTLSLKVLSLDEIAGSFDPAALLEIHPEDAAELRGGGDASASAGPLPIFRADGSEAVGSAQPSARVPRGCLAASAMHCRNLLLAPGDQYSFSLFAPSGGPSDLTCLELEVLRSWARGEEDGVDEDDEGAPAVVLEAREAGREVLRCKLGGWAHVGERVVVRAQGGALAVLRVCGTHVLSAREEAEAIGHHCFRGRVTPETHVRVVGPSGHSGVSLLNPDRPWSSDAPSAADAVTVETTDGQGGQGDPYVVQRRLLRPCIRLTQALRGGPGRKDDDGLREACPGVPGLRGATEGEVDAGDAGVAGAGPVQSIRVEVDTLTFDRVLLFLEALHLGRDPPDFAAYHMDALEAAASSLGLRALEEFCAAKRGALAERVRDWRWEEVVAGNDAGGCLLAVDGMVLDVKRWLPEHPGGDRIIPAQALNVDSTVFFELYHVTRESFLLLKEFYVGEVVPEDLPLIPPPRHGQGFRDGDVPAPSDHFLTQLRAFTPWRQQKGEIKVFKSF